jgi:hypothetical protein
MRRKGREYEPKTQPGLFDLPSQRPRWSELPPDIQRKLTELVARLLASARPEAMSCADREVEHD